MWYPSYLIHYNKNHSSKNGRFVSGDGDGDGISDDHHNYARNKQAQSGGGSSDMDKAIGDQIDEMVRKYNNPEKPTTYTLKKKDDKKNKKKKSSSRRSTSSKKTTKKTTKKRTASKITTDTFKDGLASVQQNKNEDWKNLSSNISSEDVNDLISANSGTAVTLIQQLLGK